MHHACFAQLYAWKNIYHSASNHLMAYIVLLILIEGLEEMDRMLFCPQYQPSFLKKQL